MNASADPFLALLPDALSGHGVRLERLEERHAGGLLAAGGDPAVWEHLSRGPLRDLDDARTFITAANAQTPDTGRQHPFAVIDANRGRVAGSTRYLAIRPAHRGLEIGWTWYGRDFQRTHVNTATKLLLLAHAFEALACIRVEFKTDDRNLRSQRAIERIGARREGTLCNHMIRPDGSYRHSVYYAVTADDWPQVKDRLTAGLARFGD
jgi:RimJ/RimL family protein N-acetyltransferase